MSAEVLLSICLGIGLAASAGFRVFVPLFALSAGSFFGILPLNEQWAWLASTPALVILAVASIAESASYLVPFVDNVLDSLAVPLAGFAGTLVMASTLTDMSPALTWALAIIAGGGSASLIKGTTALGRGASSVTTGGLANPAISIAETSTALGLSAFSIFMPMIAGVVAIIVLLIVIIAFTKLRNKLKKSSS